jgi:heme oxygenase
MSESKSNHSCPYAVALSDNDESQAEAGEDQLQSILQEAKSNCPAFSNGSVDKHTGCPFSNATNSEQLRQTLLQVPPSHVQQPDHSFKKALQHLHTVSGSLAQSTTQQKQYLLPGGCPVQTYISDKESGQSVPFYQAMEEFSLAAVMARMASDLLDEEDKRENEVATLPAQTTTKPEVSVEPPKSSPPSLSQALKTGTAAAHEAAENVHFVKNFIQGKIDRGCYKELVLKLYHVYDAMEEVLDKNAPLYFEACHFPNELARKQSLLEDVDFWWGTKVDLSSSQSVSPATRDYVDRLREIANQQPLLLLAHAYTRYLGDLSGGKILARVARRALNLSRDNHEGLAFYEFENIPSAKLFKDQYRQALDTMELSSEDIQALVKEANIAFLLNMRLFEELDVLANLPGARVRDIHEVLHFDDVGVKEKIQKQDEKCPFANLSGGGVAMLPNPHASPKKASSNSHEGGGRCPWPFVFFHDPIQGLRDYQTWVVVGLLMAWLWSLLQHRMET